jgi:hypothetical protein
VGQQPQWFRCDHHPNTLTVVSDTDGNIFGGFTPLEWELRKFGKHKTDNSLQSFVFTFKNPNNVPPRKFPLKPENKDKAIWCDTLCCPCFNGGISILTPIQPHWVTLIYLGIVMSTTRNLAKGAFSPVRRTSSSKRLKSSKSQIKYQFTQICALNVPLHELDLVSGEWKSVATWFFDVAVKTDCSMSNLGVIFYT